jgi:hypothetical protein
MSNSNLLYELNDAIRELDHNRVSWIDKHFIIDLNQKAQVLLESVSRLEEDEKGLAISAAKAFLTEVAQVISELKNQNQEIKK